MTLKEKLKISKNINALPKDVRKQLEKEYMDRLEAHWPGIQAEFDTVLGSSVKAGLGWLARFKCGIVFGRKLAATHALVLKQLHSKYCKED